jgi:hypothetical protein
MIVLISLDLLGPATGYDALYEAIKTQGTWWHHMRWTWIVDTAKTPEQIVDVLRSHVQSGDKILVSPLTRPYQGLLTQDAWKWISERQKVKTP